MLTDLLHFGSGTQAMHYYLACFGAILGTLQWVAARYDRRELKWFKGSAGFWLGPLAIAASLGWFLIADDQVFVPGLAGGELFLVFMVALWTAISCARLINWSLGHFPRTVLVPKPVAREKEPSA